MKAGQADRFLDARRDPNFAELVHIGNLSPQQVTDQFSLRRSAEEVELKLEEDEAAIQAFQRSSDNGKDRSHGDELNDARCAGCTILQRYC